MRTPIPLAVLVATAALGISAVSAETANPASRQLEEIVVFGVKPMPGLDLARDKTAGTIDTLSAADFQRAHALSPLEALSQQVAGINLSDIQGNGLFQDLRYRGFNASPLQGTAQAIAVYQNGVRINEAFGDTVNWDLVPEAAIERLDVWSNNPIFGLNALGGAINITMKNGFTAPGGTAEIQGGVHGRVGGVLEYGISKEALGIYGAVEGLRDGGWRRRSASDNQRLFFDAGYRRRGTELHFVAAAARSSLGVIGPTPIELIRQDESAIYTWPQTTRNRMGLAAFGGKFEVASHWELQGGIYLRRFTQRHVDGNAANFERCDDSSSFSGQLCLAGEGFEPPPGGPSAAFLDQFAIVDSGGAPIAYVAGVPYGTIDRTATRATTIGTSLQMTSDASLLGHANYFTLGGSVDYSRVRFSATSELGLIGPDLFVGSSAIPGSGAVVRTRGDLGYAPVALAARNAAYGFFAVDAFDITPNLVATLGARFNVADLSSNDRTGTAPELTGRHRYRRLNPAAGLVYKIDPSLAVYGQYAEANRAPTPLELNCADPDRPCLLENSLVADPPLKQVVVRAYEAGIRGTDRAGGRSIITWKAGAFRSDSRNDIIALASTIHGRGYFANVANTRRQGVEIGAHYRSDDWLMYASYTYLDATYRFGGDLASPSNPAADADGNIHVVPGNRIPNISPHSAKIGADYSITAAWKVGGDVSFSSSRFFAGDDGNQNPKLSEHWLANVRTSYQVANSVQVFLLVNNLFDRNYATYGTYFDTDDVGDALSTPLTDPRMLTRGQPISVYGGLKVTF